MSLLLATVDDILKLETAVLLLVTAGLLVLAKIVSDLRAEVRGLRGAAGADHRPPHAPAPVPAVSPESAGSAEIPADVFAAIVGAVYSTLGDRQRVVSVTPAESLVWSREGRRSIFRSHTFR